MLRFEVLNGWVVADLSAMGSHARVLAHGADPREVRAAITELERLEGLWSRFRPGSDVVRMNARAGRCAVAVHPDTIAVLEHAVWLWHATAGRFDPTVLTALERNGYDESFERVRSRGTSIVSTPCGRDPLAIPLGATAVLDASPAPGCAGIVVDRERATVCLPAGVTVDLGGIGKGFAADLVSTRLVERGATTACVSVGGDVRCRGTGPDAGAWSIPVEDPFEATRTLLTARLRDAAIVTSTTLLRRWVHHGRERHHLIDPTTGEPASTGVSAAIVAGDDAWCAEGFAKAALVAGVDAGLVMLEQAGLSGLLVDEHGHAHPTHRPIDEVLI